MKITFVMSRYEWRPSGGYRVVCEYANRLVSRGYEVTMVHPRRLISPAPPEQLSWLRHGRKIVEDCRELLWTPSIDWQPIDSRVKLVYVPTLDEWTIPDGDIIFATTWTTVQAVLNASTKKGRKCYLIQGYETFLGPKGLVDATWRSPLHKVVIAKWLLGLGKELGNEDLTYIPNAVDHDRYRLIRPIKNRSRIVAMLYASARVKGAAEGIEALTIAREKYPDLQAVAFGLNLLRPDIPEWIQYYRNPPQHFLIESIYNQASIYLAPSLSEGSPLPPAEAACCGCALVATNIGGFREYIEHGVTGLLSPPADAKALADNLCSLLGNDELRVQLADAAHQRLRRVTWEHSTDLLERFLMQVVHSDRIDSSLIACSSSQN